MADSAGRVTTSDLGQFLVRRTGPYGLQQFLHRRRRRVVDEEQDRHAPMLSAGQVSHPAVLAGVVWLVFSVPHAVFHAGLAGALSPGDAAGSLLALGGTVVLAAVRPGTVAGCASRPGTSTP